MSYWITPDGNYYEGAYAAAGSVTVTKRPADTYDWNGSQWVLNEQRDAQKRREAAKAERETAVAAIVVTTAAGNQFDGDEVSQGRMARAIIALQATGTSSVTWVLHDNSVIQATVAELTEALALAGAAQAAIWVIPD